MRATHSGTCQICGASQLLPGGVLAKHGYTTRWGFFSGTCRGSGHQPFEQSILMIEDAIAQAEDDARRLRKNAADHRASTDPAGIPFQVYHVGRDRRGSYRWVVADITATEHPYSSGTGSYLKFFATYTPVGEQEAVTKPVDTYGHYTLEAQVAYLRGLAAANLEQNAANLDRYVAWQRARITDWQPTELAVRS